VIYEHQDYRTYLRAILADRTSRNPSYSLRAMAQQIGCAHSSLSQVINGKKNFSPDAALRTAQRLGLQGPESEYFCVLAQLAATQDSSLRVPLLDRLRSLNPRREVHDLSVDRFRIMADWHHLAILEMTRLDPPVTDPGEIARRLGTTSIEVEAAIDRLLRLELLERTPEGSLRKTHSYSLTSVKQPDEAVQRHFHQSLEKAGEAVRALGPADRYSGTWTFPMDPSLMKEAERISDEYFARIVQLSERSRRKTDVYHVALHLFPYTRKPKRGPRAKGDST
jgi:uncharacterized protein (TIGR02147 family)